MKTSSSVCKFVCSLTLLFFVIPNIDAQTKKIKRPKSRVGITSVDNFVQNSFDIYDKVYRYDGYAKAGTPLDDSDIDVLEDALDDLSILSESAPDILSDIDGAGVFKQGKATLQMNSAKKALKYSIETAKNLLAGSPKSDEEDESETSSDEEESSSGEGDMDSSDDSEKDVEIENENTSDDLEGYSKFDFVPGDKIIYFDDFILIFLWELGTMVLSLAKLL